MLLLLLRIKLPAVLATPPDKVNNAEPLALLLVSVVAVLLVVSNPLIVNAEVVLFSVMAVTFVPIPALIVVVPVPVPELVIVPVLLIGNAPDSVMEPTPLAFSIKLPVPVMPRLNVILLAVGDITKLLLRVIAPLKILEAMLSIVAVPVFPAATEIGLAKVTAPAPRKVVLAEPLELPIVIILAFPPNEFVAVPVTIPALIKSPEV